MADILTVVRYSNRKLYCQNSKYTTLGWIRERILAGQPVRVLSHPAGEDITASTVARILMKDAEEGRLAAGMLMSLLRAYAAEEKSLV